MSPGRPIQLAVARHKETGTPMLILKADDKVLEIPLPFPTARQIRDALTAALDEGPHRRLPRNLVVTGTRRRR